MRHFTSSQKKKQSAFQRGENLFICDLFNCLDVSSCVVVGTLQMFQTSLLVLRYLEYRGSRFL